MAKVTRVLIADDDPGIRKLLEVVLVDFALLFAEDGRTALDLLVHEAVDVVVCDVMMPGIDGLEVVRSIRRDAKLQRTPVILLTARVGEDAHIKGFEAGADAYLTKPFSPEELVTVIAQVRGRTLEQREHYRKEQRARAEVLRQVERRFE